MSIQQRLITLRRERDLIQQQMADAIGVHVNQVRRYEAGATQPSLDALKKIAVAMSVTIDSIGQILLRFYECRVMTLFRYLTEKML